MNLNNSDREFFESLNRDLAKSFQDAISSANFGGGGAAGGGSDDAKGGAFAKAAAALGKAFGDLAGKGFNLATGKLRQISEESLEFGNILARSTAATNKTQLLASKTINAQGQVIRGLPQISDSFRKFGLSTTQTARSIDGMIRANIRDTGKTAQAFVATSTGLGNSLSTTNKFLATQTNVLGRSTEATAEFGMDILGLVASNGLLADSIMEAVTAFAETTKRQAVLFGGATANVVQKMIAAGATLAPDAGMNKLVEALTSPETLVKIPAIAGRLGIEAPTDVRDAAQMEKFLSEAIPAIVAFGKREIEGQDAVTAQFLSQGLVNTLGEVFSLDSIAAANRFVEGLERGGYKISQVFDGTKLTNEQLKDAQDNVTGASIDAVKAMTDFNVAMALVPSYVESIGKASNLVIENMPTSQEILDRYGEFFDVFTQADVGLRLLNSNAINAANGLKDLLIGLGAGALLTGAGRGVARGVGGSFGAVGRGQARGAAARSARVAGMSDDAVKAAVGGLDDATLRSLGYSRNARGRIVNAATGKFGANRAVLEAAQAAGTAGRIGPRLAGAGRLLGKAAVPIGIAMPIIDEAMSEDGDLTRGIARSGGGILGGAAAGAGLGALGANPFTIGAGAIIGAIIGEEGVRRGYDYIFGEDGEEGRDEVTSQNEQSVFLQEQQLDQLIGLRADLLERSVIQDSGAMLRNNPSGENVPQAATGLTNR